VFIHYILIELPNKYFVVFSVSVSDFKRDETEFFDAAKNFLNPDLSLSESLSNLSFNEMVDLSHKIPPNVDVRRKEHKNYLPVNSLNSGPEIRFEIDDNMSIPFCTIYFKIVAQFVWTVTPLPSTTQLNQLNFGVPDDLADFLFGKLSVTLGSNNREIDNTNINVPIGAFLKKVILTPVDASIQYERLLTFFKDPGSSMQFDATGSPPNNPGNGNWLRRQAVFSPPQVWACNWRLPHGLFDLNKILPPHVKLYLRLTLNDPATYLTGIPNDNTPAPFIPNWWKNIKLFFHTFEMRCLGLELADSYSATFKKAIADRTLRAAEEQVNLLEFNIDRNLYSSGLYDANDYRVMSASIPSGASNFTWQILSANPLPASIFWVFINRNADSPTINPCYFPLLTSKSRLTINSKSIPNWDIFYNANSINPGDANNAYRFPDIDEYEQFRDACGFYQQLITNSIGIDDWQTGYGIYGRVLNQTGNPNDVTPLLQGSLNIEFEFKVPTGNNVQVVALLVYNQVYFLYSDRRFDVAYAY
jgi:hypothetical protein